MAVSTTPVSSELILVNDVDGTKTQNRYFKNVKNEALDADVFSVAQSLITLQTPANVAIQRKNIVELEEIV